MKEPPKIPLKVLRWFCSEERIEELEGDLFEIYQEIGALYPRSAKLHYWLMVFKSFRFYALKNSKQQKINSMTNFIMLLKHNVKLILRQLWQNKTTTAINITGLVIGIAGFISIYSLVRYEYSFNNHIPEKEKVYRLYTTFSGELTGFNRGVATGIAPFLKENPHQEVEYVTRFFVRSYEAKTETKTNESFGRVKSAIVDTSFFKVFGQYQWLAGNPSTALKDPFQLVLTIEQAEKYFGYLTPSEMIGKRVIYRDSLKTTVSGIISQMEGNSDFIYTDFISFSTIDKSWIKKNNPTNDWQSTNSSSQTWVKTNFPLKSVEEPLFLKALNEHIDEIATNADFKRKIKTKSLSTLHFDQDLSIFDNRGRSPADPVILSVLSVVCIALLLMAMFNFINLETAQASGRAKEVGVKKVLGSNRTTIFTKFILESLIITTLATIIALPLAHVSLKYFSDFIPDEMQVNLFTSHYFLLAFILIAVVGILSGVYPALRISGVSIGRALKANARMSFSEKGTPIMRKMLVSFQFICSQVLIIAAISVFFQVRYLLNKDMGFSNDQVMSIYGHWNEPVEKVKLLYSELEKIPAITHLNRQNDTPASNGYSSTIMTYYDSIEPIKNNVFRKTGDTTFLDFYKINLLAGRNISPHENLKEIIINETYTKKLGFNSPLDAIGKVISADEDDNYTIVGVMNDFHSTSLKSEIQPLMFFYQNEVRGIAFKTSPENTEKVIAEVTKVYRDIYPNQPASIYFMDKTIRNFYNAEQKTSKLALITTVLAILISGLGLFGLISITVIQRTKEVGIRKVLGAGLWSLSKVIAKEFVWLIVIAFVISIPIAHYILQDWMANFAYQATLGWWVYLLSGVLSILLAIMAIGVKIYHAIVSNPIESLRYE